MHFVAIRMEGIALFSIICIDSGFHRCGDSKNLSVARNSARFALRIVAALLPTPLWASTFSQRWQTRVARKIENSSERLCKTVSVDEWNCRKQQKTFWAISSRQQKSSGSAVLFKGITELSSKKVLFPLRLLNQHAHYNCQPQQVAISPKNEYSADQRQ